MSPIGKLLDPPKRDRMALRRTTRSHEGRAEKSQESTPSMIRSSPQTRVTRTRILTGRSRCRVRERHRCRSLPSEPDWMVSHHPAQAVCKPHASGAGVTTQLDRRCSLLTLSLFRSSKYPRQCGSNGLASDFTLTCRTMGVLVGSTSLDITVRERCALESASTAKHHLRLPSLYQYRSAIQVADFFG